MSQNILEYKVFCISAPTPSQSGHNVFTESDFHNDLDNKIAEYILNVLKVFKNQLIINI